MCAGHTPSDFIFAKLCLQECLPVKLDVGADGCKTETAELGVPVELGATRDFRPHAGFQSTRAVWKTNGVGCTCGPQRPWWGSEKMEVLFITRARREAGSIKPVDSLGLMFQKARGPGPSTWKDGPSTEEPIISSS